MPKHFAMGKCWGEMLPYCRYEFEISHLIREKDNEVSVEIEDMDVVFGPSEGWENYGGIIREVKVAYLGSGKISDCFFRADYADGYAAAHCRVSYEADGQGKKLLMQTQLKNRENAVIHAEEAEMTEKAEMVFSVPNPILWSPDFPYLYTLESRLYDGETLLDIREEKVGFRDFSIQGKRSGGDGKAIVWGTLSEGGLNVGDKLYLHNRSNSCKPVEIIGFDRYPSEHFTPSKGIPAAIIIRGISRDLISIGDRITNCKN